MLKKYPIIYSLQLIHGRQARQVYADKANEKANLLADSCTKTAFDRSRQERITSIIGPIGTSEVRHSLAVCKPIFIKDKFWGYATVLYKEKRLFKPTFNKLDKLGYNYRLSKTFITGGGYQPLSSNLPEKSQSEITCRLGGCSWKMEAARKDAGQMPQEVKSGIFSGIFTVVINTILAALLLNYLERGRRLSRLLDTDYLTGM
jgi:sensor domain CHASE-containing protein